MIQKEKNTESVKKQEAKKQVLKKLFGSIKWGEDPVKYQRRLRDGK